MNVIMSARLRLGQTWVGKCEVREMEYLLRPNVRLAPIVPRVATYSSETTDSPRTTVMNAELRSIILRVAGK